MIPNRTTLKREIVRRSTSQRELVLEAICKGNHLSAREIFEIVSKKARMSFGTVYRNLQILVEEGRIIAVEADPSVLRYDRRLSSHYHLHCKKCGKVFDMPLSYYNDLDKNAGGASGFLIESHTISFKGLCPDCQKEA
ncbi:MAG: transcriptional repressor [Spirochaetales bacterium]|jgi:Fe2+ or Zn2+ uptake regulation protein|nr:transcriptional repressor [Spirochaetales bacterium]